MRWTWFRIDGEDVGVIVVALNSWLFGFGVYEHELQDIGILC